MADPQDGWRCFFPSAIAGFRNFGNMEYPKQNFVCFIVTVFTIAIISHSVANHIRE